MEHSPPLQLSPTPPLVIDLTNSDDEVNDRHGDNDDNDQVDRICYPLIHDMLVELDSELPHLGITRYEHILAEDGFMHVNQLVNDNIEHHLWIELSIPFGIVKQLQSRAERLMRRAQKSKVKQEE
jgi:hypothetical protein